MYLRHYFYNDPKEPLPPRGALTEGRTLPDAFNELAKSKLNDMPVMKAV